MYTFHFSLLHLQYAAPLMVASDKVELVILKEGDIVRAVLLAYIK